jgi:hypothetical protein
MDQLIAVSRDQILRRIRAEYLEMPGLRLTHAQAERLWGLDYPTCEELLERLTADRFLQRRGDGTYARSSEGPMVFPAPRMVKAAPSPAVPPLVSNVAKR